MVVPGKHIGFGGNIKVKFCRGSERGSIEFGYNSLIRHFLNCAQPGSTPITSTPTPTHLPKGSSPSLVCFDKYTLRFKISSNGSDILLDGATCFRFDLEVIVND